MFKQNYFIWQSNANACMNILWSKYNELLAFDKKMLSWNMWELMVSDWYDVVETQVCWWKWNLGKQSGLFNLWLKVKLNSD